MFEGIDADRVSNMNPREQRWFDNICKAFHESDQAMQGGQPETKCLKELLNAIDTAKTLRRSLRGEDISSKHNKERFVEFLALEIPAARRHSEAFQLRTKATGTTHMYTLGEVVYDIRCMAVHESENLNAAEGVDYHILLDWSVKTPQIAGTICEGKLTINGYFLWNRLREVLAKFITGIESFAQSARGEGFSISIRPGLGTIKPKRTTK